MAGAASAESLSLGKSTCMGTSEAVSLAAEKVCCQLMGDKIGTWDKVMSMNTGTGVYI